MKYPGLLQEDVARVGTADAMQYNIMAGTLMTEMARTALGPRGMEKIYVDILGEITVTKHGGALLRKIDLNHPAAKAVVEAVNAVDTHVGDGTVSTAVLVGALLKEAEVMLGAGISPVRISRGYEAALDIALEELDSVSIISDTPERLTMQKLVETCLAGKAVSESVGRSRITGIILDAVYGIADMKHRTIETDDIKIEEKTGMAAETRLVRGVILDKSIDNAAMPRSIRDARILLLNEALEVMRTRTESGIEITSPDQIPAFLEKETQDIMEKTARIADAGADVVVSRRGIGDAAQEYLARRGIISIRRAKYNDIWWLEKATGSITCRDTESIRPDELGLARHVHEETVGGDKMVFFECESPRSVTLLLRAGTKRYLDEFHRSVLNAVYVLRNYIADPRLVGGRGALEAVLSGRIRERASIIEGSEQRAAMGFAGALEEIPATLARNAGMDQIDAMAELRSKYAAPGTDARWQGIDSDSRKVSDALPDVVETAAVKRQMLVSATEAVNQILRTDDVFVKDIIDNTHCHIDGTVHAHKDGGKAHNHFEQEGLEQRQMHHYY